MSWNKLIPIIFLIFIIVIGVTFLPLLLGSVEAGQTQNLSPDYQHQLNASRNASITTLVIVKYISVGLGIVALIGVLTWIGKR